MTIGASDLLLVSKICEKIIMKQTWVENVIIVVSEYSTYGRCLLAIFFFEFFRLIFCYEKSESSHKLETRSRVLHSNAVW